MDNKPSKSSLLYKQTGVFVTALVICTAGISLTGDWLVITTALAERTKPVWSSASNWTTNDVKDLSRNVAWSTGPTLILYWVFCEFLQWNYYKRQRNTPENWKCQPRKFLSKEDERNEMYLGALSLTIASVVSGVISWYIENGGCSTIYSKISDHGWMYFAISILVHYLVADFLLYWAHRIFHMPFFYKWIHKYHHRYKQPTAYSFSAMHPIEMLTYQMITLAPIFIVPIHWAALLINVSYSFYYGILDHSGIKFTSIWPWQPPTTFHDNHHQYFHCNFGFHTVLFDRMFETLRKKDRVYNENIFYGSGKSLDQASREEITEHEYNIKDD